MPAEDAGLVGLASRIDRALAAAPERFAGVLRRPVMNETLGWALSLVLALWRLKRSNPGSVRAVLEDASLRAGELVKQLDSMSALMPDAVSKGLDAAAEARRPAADDPKIASAQVYLKAALSGSDMMTTAVLGWLNGRQFGEAAQALVQRFSRASSPSTSAVSALPPQPPTISRAARFDREGRPPPAVKAPAQTARQVGFAFSQADVATAYMASTGWSAEEVERFSGGPESATRTGLAVFRRFRALPLAERVQLVTELKRRGEFGIYDAASSAPKKSSITMAMLEPQAGYASSLDAYKDYSALTATEKVTFLMLVDETDDPELRDAMNAEKA